jgi:hypothetical protein
MKESTEDKFSTVLAQLDQLLSERMEFVENKLKDRYDVFIKRIAELTLLLDTVLKKHHILRERYAESFKERFEKITQ